MSLRTPPPIYKTGSNPTISGFLGITTANHLPTQPNHSKTLLLRDYFPQASLGKRKERKRKENKRKEKKKKETKRKERKERMDLYQYLSNKNLRPFDGTQSKIATQIPRCWCHFHGDRVISLTSATLPRSNPEVPHWGGWRQPLLLALSSNLGPQNWSQEKKYHFLESNTILSTPKVLKNPFLKKKICGFFLWGFRKHGDRNATILWVVLCYGGPVGNPLWSKQTRSVVLMKRSYTLQKSLQWETSIGKITIGKINCCTPALELPCLAHAWMGAACGPFVFFSASSYQRWTD